MVLMNIMFIHNQLYIKLVYIYNKFYKNITFKLNNKN